MPRLDARTAEISLKYRQRGYRDSESGPGKRRDAPPEDQAARDQAREEARKVRHAMQRSASIVLRCAECGHQTSGAIEVAFDTTCPKCNVALHNCRNCRHFDTQARFECRQTIPERIASKTVANRCELYDPRAVLDATGRRAEIAAAEDPRSAFDRLFKK